ncbi:MAG: hypothetical protein CMN75_03915 [Spirochaeta sp.]|nr:hypothetical protein [Spirochaeta sp.]RPG04744.1 MAG: hypothetical protein CBC32_013780 [Proteobacteria bacterium TMED72]
MSQAQEPGDRPSLPAAPVALDEIGLGPESTLMREPKLFQDRAFLGLLLKELNEQLGSEASHRALFQIGAWHGMREARRIWQAPAAYDTKPQDPTSAQVPSLGMRLFSEVTRETGERLHGSWPDHHEARARLSHTPETHEPACFLSSGYTSGWLSETHGRDFVVIEDSCLAAGDTHCSFRAIPDAVSTKRPQDHHEPEPGSEDSEFLENGDAIHIWGPVMVLPCRQLDIAFTTLQNLLSDQSLRDIRVIVLDLNHSAVPAEGIAPDGFEKLLQLIKSWGVEILLSGAEARNLRARSPLQCPFMIGPKRLQESIAMAFQIADVGLHAA